MSEARIEYPPDGTGKGEKKIPFIFGDVTSMARCLRLAIVQNQYNFGNLSEEEAEEILSGPLSPGDDSTIVDDREYFVP